MKTKNNNGFSLIEILVVLFMGLLLTYFSLEVFNRGNQTAINQDETSAMDANLTNIASMMRLAIGNAGFGMKDDAQYAVRTFDNVGNALPNSGGFASAGSPNILRMSSGALTVKAMGNSDAILLTESVPACETVTIVNPAAGLANMVMPGGQTGAVTVFACVPVAPPERCTAFNSAPGTDVTTMFQGENHSFAIVNRTVTAGGADATINFSVNAAFIRNTDGQVVTACGGRSYLEISGTAQGVQISNAWAYTAGAGENLAGHLVRARFFYVGEDRNLYAIPGGYTNAGQASFILANNIENMQLQYFMAGDTSRCGYPGGIDSSPSAFTAPCGAGTNNAAIVDLDGDSLEESQDVRQVDLALVARSVRFDREYKGQGVVLTNGNGGAMGGGPYPADNYRRRVLRENILAKNLQMFGFQRCAPGGGTCSYN